VKGVAAAAFQADASDAEAIAGAIERAREELGPIGVIHWNAYSGGEAGDLIAATPASVRRVFETPVVGLLAAVQAALADLKAAGDGAVLVTNGAYGELAPQIDMLAVSQKAMGLAVGNAAKHKLVGLLSQRLKGDGVFVGEVMIAGAVRGTAADTGGPTIDPAAIADKFWELYRARDAIRARVS
jgi:NAD(P)-dependent dehydrogenase (short-subunit alcohol dehydrogenase family)